MLSCNINIHSSVSLQAKLLSKELELLRDSQQSATAQRDETESSYRSLEKALKTKEWELQDVTAIKDARYYGRGLTE